MFTARGAGAKRNADTTVTVRADVTDDRTNKVVQTVEVTGTNLADVKRQLDTQLGQLAAAEDDSALSKAVVGRVLSTV